MPPLCDMIAPMDASKTLSNELSTLIDATISAIGIAPGLQPRARRNLIQIAETQGKIEIERRLQEALDRKHRARLWLQSREQKAPLDEIEWVPLGDTGKIYGQRRFWTALAKLSQSNLAIGSRWAKYAAIASQKIGELDWSKDYSREVIFACHQLANAIYEQDFLTASNRIRGPVLAETANVFALCGFLSNNREVIAHSLVLYREAASSIAAEDAPSVLAIVQLNRCQTLIHYGNTVRNEMLQPFDADVVEVTDFMRHSPDTNFSDLFVPIDVKRIRDNLYRLDRFFRGFRPDTSSTILSSYRSYEFEGDPNRDSELSDGRSDYAISIVAGD